MRLSLPILADWFEKYHPVCHITEGSRSIRNVRIFSDEISFTPNNVYVGLTGIDSGFVILIHGNDYIVLHTGDENQVMNEIMDAFDFYNNWSDNLNREISQITVQEILDQSTQVLHGNLMLTNAAYYLLAYTYSRSHALQDPALSEIAARGILNIGQILDIEQDPQIRRFNRHCYLQETGGFPLKTSVRNLFTGGRHWGWLVCAIPEVSQGQMDIQDELGDILELWMQTNQDIQNSWEQNGVFLSILDSSYKSPDSVEYQLSLLGWKPQETNWVYAFSVPEISRALFHKVDLLSPNVHSCIYQDRLLAVLHGTQWDRKVFEEQLALLLKQSNCRCGCSPEFQSMLDLKEYYALALSASEYGKESISCFSEIALQHSVSLLQKYGSVHIIHPALTTLWEYDKENHTTFYVTFYHFLRSERSYSKTCEVMGLHRNTLLYRIARIEKITELNLNDPDIRLHLLLSYALDLTVHSERMKKLY